MAISDILTIVLISSGVLVFLVAWWMFSRSLWPERVARARVAIQRGGRCFLVGVIPFALLMGIGIAILSRAQQLWFVAALILVFTIMFSHTGVSAMALRMSERMRAEGEPEWRGHRRACWTLAGLFLLPVIGWFVLPMVFGAMGMGAMLLSRGAAKALPVPPPPPLPVTPPV